MLGVVKLLVALPLVNTVPPVAASYQSITAPDEGVALRVTVPASQREAPAEEATVGNAFTTADLVT
jgi:hypothetical protein